MLRNMQKIVPSCDIKSSSNGSEPMVRMCVGDYVLVSRIFHTLYYRTVKKIKHT